MGLNPGVSFGNHPHDHSAMLFTWLEEKLHLMNDSLKHEGATFLLKAPKVFLSLQSSSKSYTVEAGLGILKELMMILLA